MTSSLLLRRPPALALPFTDGSDALDRDVGGVGRERTEIAGVRGDDSNPRIV